MTDTFELPYTGGTVDEMRQRIARHAIDAEHRFSQITDKVASGKPLTDAGREAHLISHHAMLYAWTTVSLLGFIRDKYGADAMNEAAEMVDDMGANGGAPHAEDLDPTTLGGS